MTIVPLKLVEKAAILNALKHFNGDKKKAAEALGVSVNTIYNKLARYSPELR